MFMPPQGVTKVVMVSARSWGALGTVSARESKRQSGRPGVHQMALMDCSPTMLTPPQGVSMTEMWVKLKWIWDEPGTALVRLANCQLPRPGVVQKDTSWPA